MVDEHRDDSDRPQALYVCPALGVSAVDPFGPADDVREKLVPSSWRIDRDLRDLNASRAGVGFAIRITAALGSEIRQGLLPTHRDPARRHGSCCDPTGHPGPRAGGCEVYSWRSPSAVRWSRQLSPRNYS